MVHHDLGHDRSSRIMVSTDALVEALHDITDGENTKPYLIEVLKNKKISGSECITRLRNEDEHPLVLLTCDN